MVNKVKISVLEIAGHSLCVASKDGDKLFERIVREVENGNHVVISFLGVKLLTSAFLNNGIGCLYEKFSEDKIRNSLKVVDIEQDDLSLLRGVVNNAKRYFKNPQRYDRAIKKVGEY